jgi:hypothetical protein
MKQIITLLLLSIILYSCSKEEPEKEITSIVGHRYVANYERYSYTEKRDINLFLIYSFGNDGVISIEERLDSENGTLYETNIGYFEYNHPVLELKINSGCEECFNYFTANVSDDKKDFSYSIYVLSYNKNVTLEFKLKDK